MQTSPRPFAFVLMPFERAYDDVYELAICAACTEAGAYAERVDKQIFAGNILERVYNQIAKADLVIADMSDRNANVFYEVGYAHALGKTTILVTKDDADIPFDLKHYPHIVYGDSLSRLKVELLRSVQWHLANPTSTAANLPDVSVRVNGVEIVGEPRVPAKVRGAENSIRLGVSLKNVSRRSIRTLNFRLALVVPESVVGATDERSQPYLGIMDEGRRTFACTTALTLLPEQLDLLHFRLSPANAGVEVTGENYECCIRLYFESGTLDYPFTISVGGGANAG